MTEIRTLYEIRRGWWIETRATVLCALPRDGLVVVLDRTQAESTMDKHYPHEGSGERKRWYFNSTKDREIAEIDVEGRISANPRALTDHFMQT